MTILLSWPVLMKINWHYLLPQQVFQLGCHEEIRQFRNQRHRSSLTTKFSFSDICWYHKLFTCLHIVSEAKVVFCYLHGQRNSCKIRTQKDGENKEAKRQQQYNKNAEILTMVRRASHCEDTPRLGRDKGGGTIRVRTSSVASQIPPWPFKFSRSFSVWR